MCAGVWFCIWVLRNSMIPGATAASWRPVPPQTIPNWNRQSCCDGPVKDGWDRRDVSVSLPMGRPRAGAGGPGPRLSVPGSGGEPARLEEPFAEAPVLESTRAGGSPPWQATCAVRSVVCVCKCAWETSTGAPGPPAGPRADRSPLRAHRLRPGPWVSLPLCPAFHRAPGRAREPPGPSEGPSRLTGQI